MRAILTKIDLATREKTITHGQVSKEIADVNKNLTVSDLKKRAEGLFEGGIENYQVRYSIDSGPFWGRFPGLN